LNKKSKIDQLIVEAHRQNDKKKLIKLYFEASKLFSKNKEISFFLTQAYVFSLDVGDDIESKKLFHTLKQH
jgi:hypothetical protein